MTKFDITSLDATKLQDWQIAEEAEKHMKPVQQLADEWGIKNEELLPYGHYLGKVDYAAIVERLKDRPNAKYIDVTAITPTPLGEGKSTTAMGLVPGIAKRGKNVSGAIRQPSGGPTFNIKGSAAGGGLSNDHVGLYSKSQATANGLGRCGYYPGLCHIPSPITRPSGAMAHFVIEWLKPGKTLAGGTSWSNAIPDST